MAVAALVVAGALLYAWHGSVVLVVAELVPAALLFPAAHDEAYNFSRLWIDFRAQYDDGFNILAPPSLRDRLAWAAARQKYRYGYQSPTTTARNDFDGRERTWLAATGALLLLGLYLFCT